MDLDLSLGDSGLKFSKEDLNMAAINISPLQNLKGLSKKYNYSEHLTEVVFGKLMCGNKVFPFQNSTYP